METQLHNAILRNTGSLNRKESVMQSPEIKREINALVNAGATDFYTLPKQEQDALLVMAFEAYDYDVEVVLAQADNRVFAKALLSNNFADIKQTFTQVRDAVVDKLGWSLDCMIESEAATRFGSAA